jgi:hypothetical protein
VLAGCWPEQIRYLEEGYQTLPFPFDEKEMPEFWMRANWTLDQFAGFLDSWSAVRRYQRGMGRHPLEVVWGDLARAWGEDGTAREIRWRLYMRVGRVG